MITEAFTIKYNNNTAYLNIDRTYKYGGIMLAADPLYAVCLGGIDGYTYFTDFSLKKWLDQLNITDGVLTMCVDTDAEGMINSNIYILGKENDILSITIKNKVVVEVKNSNNEIVYTRGDDEINGWAVGWFGKVFNYYTNVISENIKEYEKYDYYIWGVYYD